MGTTTWWNCPNTQCTLYCTQCYPLCHFLMSTPTFALKRVIPITQARRDLFAITTAVKTRGVRYIITENGRPKAAMVPLADVERLAAGGASIAADAPLVGYGGMSARPAAVWCVGDAVGGTQHRRYATKEITRSRLSVSLIEKYGYGLERLAIGHYVQITDSRYIEADLIVHDGDGAAQMVFMVVPPQMLAEQLATAIDDLYQVAAILAVQGQTGIRYLVCYAYDATRAAGARERAVVIDYRRYASIAAWRAAASPTTTVIPTAAKLA